MTPSRDDGHVEGPGHPMHPLPAQHAFLVQVRGDVEVGRECVAGRVEHVVSGQAIHFASSEELLAFIARVLSTLPARRGEPEGAA